MSITITSFISDNGIPVTGIIPTLKIWEVTPITNTLVINNASMSEIGDGYYKYIFLTYDSTKDYLVRVDAGSTTPICSRYYTSEITSGSTTITPGDIAAIADAVWDEDISDHLIGGSTGESLNMTQTDTAQTLLNTITLMNWVEELLKYDRNRTRIDKTAKTLTVYDDDEVTPLRVFYLRDHNGVLSVEEVCERDPI